MLYLEAPAFVGFSYSNTPSDANTNDNRTAVDNRVALDVFFHGFPELASNALFIAGEVQLLDDAASKFKSLAANILCYHSFFHKLDRESNHSGQLSETFKPCRKRENTEISVF